VRIADSTSRKRSQIRWSRSSQAACGRCTGIPMPMNGLIFSRAPDV
jgi:hypothetical protein